MCNLPFKALEGRIGLGLGGLKQVSIWEAGKKNGLILHVKRRKNKTSFLKVAQVQN